MSQQRLRDKFSLYVILFLLFCLIGWIYEVTLAFLYGYGFVNRGFLYGPWLPVYGFGILILIALLHRVMAKDLQLARVKITPVVVFGLIILIATVIEYITGYALETLFGQVWWDYSHYPMNLHGRICVSASLRFGIGGMVFLYILTPLFRGLLDRIKGRTRLILALTVIAGLALDLFLTFHNASEMGFAPPMN